MNEWLTWDDLAARWQVTKRHAQTIARSLGIVPILLAPQTPRFPLSAVKKAEKQRSH